MRVEFEGLIADVDKSLFDDFANLVTIEFGNDMQVQFKRNDKCRYVAIDGVDGWGDNIKSKIEAKN